MPCRVFISYATADRSIGGLDEFVDRLFKTIGGLAGLPPTEVGFRDREGIELGSEWLPTLAAALANCNIMVALVSPNFLKSDWCAREFQVFLERRQNHRRPDGNPHRWLLGLDQRVLLAKTATIRPSRR